MLPTSLTLRNYRSFPGPVTLELRPITLLFGINNAGKSALLRALPLLSDSLAPTATAPLDLESPAARGSSFEDLRWKNVSEDDDQDLGLSLSWETPGQPFLVDFSLRFYSDLRRLILRRFAIRNGGDLAFQAEWRPVSRERSAELTYEIQAGPEEPGALVRHAFQGLLPSEELTSRFGHLLFPASEKLEALRNQVQWLTASRQPPLRTLPLPTGPRWRMKPDGSDAATVLAASPDMLSEVSSWYEKQLRRRLVVRDVPGGTKLMLNNQEKAAFDVDLTDTGEGMIQVLPVLTALALARRRCSGGPGILAIEEPESHLHASLQRALAETFCELATQSTPPRIVLETHSEQLLLGVQLQIVRGVIPPDKVLLYWVHQLESGESLAERVTFDRDARPQGNWPPGVFSDDTEVARQIVQERRERERAAS